MASSLNEIKTRISSVKSTRKITSAMKMIASAKLNKAQATISSFLPYQEKLDMILTNVLSADTSYDSPFTIKREVKRVAIVACTSNSSLCGGFNSNIIKKFGAVYGEKSSSFGADNILVYPIGKKIAKSVKQVGIKAQGDYESIADNPSYEETQALAKELIKKYVDKEIDEVILIYSHFISTGSQKLKSTTYLPFDLEKENVEGEAMNEETDYIFEPSKEEILDNLIPTVLYSRLYAAFLDSYASEHAARMMAMQTATDNADELNEDLTILYNKQRQQAVTNELLDIIGGANAIS